jgi:hypothetical protein
MALANGLASVQFLSHQSNLQVNSNTLHIFNPSAGAPPDVTELTTLATQIVAQFSTTYRALLVTSGTWDQVVLKSVALPGTTDIPGEAAAATNLAGTRTVTGTAVPQALCGVISLRVPAATRRFRGHLFAPPAFNAGALSGNILNTSDPYWTNLSAFALELAKGTPTGAGWTGSSLSHYQLVVYSKTQAAAALPYTGLVQAVVARPQASFLRSRQRGGT